MNVSTTNNPFCSVIPLSTPGIFAAKLLLPFGSALDPVGKRGAHDLLASLLSRGCGTFSNEAMADLVEGCGAGLRCDAHEDALTLSLRCTVDDADRLLPLLNAMVREPHLDQDQVDLERSLSIQAIQRQREDPFHLASLGWRQLAYGSGGYGHDPVGLEEDLQTIDRDDLVALAEQLPTGSCAFAVAGSLPPHFTSDLVAAAGFQDWPSALNQALPPSPGSDGAGITQTIQLQPMDTEQVVLMLGQAAVGHAHPDDLPLRLLQCHLGAGMSSLLFQRLREEHGVAYDVSAHFPALIGTAPFVLSASTASDRAGLTLKLLHEIWMELGTQLLCPEALALAKAKFIGQVAHGLQTCSQRAERSVQLQSMHLPEHHDQICIERLETLTAEDLNAAAQRWLSQPLLSLCGPASTLDTLSRQWQRP